MNGEHVNWSLVIMMYDFIKQELRQKQNGPGANRLAAALCTDSKFGQERSQF